MEENKISPWRNRRWTDGDGDDEKRFEEVGMLIFWDQCRLLSAHQLLYLQYDLYTTFTHLKSTACSHEVFFALSYVSRETTIL